jgi:transposase
MCEREQRGLAISAVCKLTLKAGVWLVPSQSANKQYTVSNGRCTCPDHETRGVKCKHIFAVEFVIRREQDGTITETLTVKRTYRQNWPAYNAAQVNEKQQFQALLHDLCRGIEEPVPGRGRPRIPLSDAIFSARFKVYSTVSGRRFMSDLRDAHGRGLVRRMPCYNSIFNVFESPETFPVLQSLVVESAVPLKPLETKFACDSSGFSSSRFDRWYDHKHGKHQIQRAWVKAHVMTGVRTNVVSAVEILGQDANDSPLLKPMLATTAINFQVDEVSADLAYSSRSNLAAIDAAGAFPAIPFKSNATPASGGLWAKMYHYVSLNRDEFLSRYHLRSNVESTFSMVKAKFADGVRSRLDTAMKNEVLAKLVCHNICCLISAMYETGLRPAL